LSRKNTTYGIVISSGNNITIRNGNITGCFTGLCAGNSYNLVIENIDFSGNCYTGASLGGPNNIVRHCIFNNIGGYEIEAYSIGLNNIGDNALVENNIFHNLYRQVTAQTGDIGEGVCIICKPG